MKRKQPGLSRERVMNPLPGILILIILLLFSSVIPRQEKQGTFEIVSMHHSTYAVQTEYLLPDAGMISDTISVVLIQNGKVVSVDRYVFVERRRNGCFQLTQRENVIFVPKLMPEGISISGHKTEKSEVH
jgi:hypothetical protein